MSINKRLQKVIEDPRYTIALEYTGKATPVYVIRFCGSFVSADSTEAKAVLSAIIHQDERTLKILEKCA